MVQYLVDKEQKKLQDEIEKENRKEERKRKKEGRERKKERKKHIEKCNVNLLCKLTSHYCIATNQDSKNGQFFVIKRLYHKNQYFNAKIPSNYAIYSICWY